MLSIEASRIWAEGFMAFTVLCYMREQTWIQSLSELTSVLHQSPAFKVGLQRFIDGDKALVLCAFPLSVCPAL